MNKERLQEIFDFSDDEIYANREGYLTNKQEDFLEKYRKGIRRGWIFSFVIIFLCISFWVGMGIVSSGNNSIQSEISDRDCIKC